MKTFFTCCAIILSLSLEASLGLDSVNYVPVGCYKDDQKTQRPLPELIHNYRLNEIDWHDLEGSVVQACAREARKRNYLYFGIQFYGECWSGPRAHETYFKDGQSSYCTRGVGKQETNMVYRLTGDENECVQYHVFNTKERSVLHQKSGTACDNGYDSSFGGPFVPGWYRFEGEAGVLLNDKPLYKRCLTYGVGWYRGSYPEVAQGIVDEKKACFSESCDRYVYIRIRNCGEFFVFDLKRIPGCNYRYCGNGKITPVPKKGIVDNKQEEDAV